MKMPSEPVQSQGLKKSRPDKPGTKFQMLTKMTPHVYLIDHFHVNHHTLEVSFGTPSAWENDTRLGIL